MSLNDEYKEFVESLKAIRLRRKENETEWVNWTKQNGGYFVDKDSNIAIFPIGDDYKLEVQKTNGTDTFVYQNYNMKINEKYEMSITKDLRNCFVYSYEDLLKSINESKLYIKRFKEIKKWVELQGDFQ